MTDTTQIPPDEKKDEKKSQRQPLILDTRTFIVAWMMVSSFILVVLCWWKPPPAENQIVTMLVSVYVSTGFVTALQWWMGSSKGSDDNRDTIKSQTAVIAKQLDVKNGA